MAELALCAVIVLLLALFGASFVRLGLKKMVIVAFLAATASAGRVAMAAIPSVQPSSFIIIMAGILFGPGAGLICGVINGFLSNLLLGMFWPFAAWHMFLWGIMGLVAGLLRRLPVWVHAALGFVWGFVFGWVTNLWWYTTGALAPSWSLYLLANVSSVRHDLAHALTNLVLISAFAMPMKKIFKKMGVYDNADTGTGP